MLSIDNIRELFAESGKTTVREFINYMDSRYSGKYDKKAARVEAIEMIKEMKAFI